MVVVVVQVAGHIGQVGEGGLGETGHREGKLRGACT